MLLPYSCSEGSGSVSAPGSGALLVQILSASSGQQVLPQFFWRSPSNWFYIIKKTIQSLSYSGGGGFSEERMTEFFIFGETNQTLLFKNNNGS